MTTLMTTISKHYNPKVIETYDAYKNSHKWVSKRRQKDLVKKKILKIDQKKSRLVESDWHFPV